MQRGVSVNRQVSRVTVSATLPMDSAEDPPAAEASGSALPPPPKSTSALIMDALTDVPQTSEMVHQSVVNLADGAYAVPGLNTVQSALSTRGDKMGKRVKAGKRTHWVRFAEGETPTSVKQAAGKKAGKRSAKPTKKSLKADEAKKKTKAEKPVDFRALKVRSEEILAKPISAFVLFGFSQRGVLKKQAKSTTVKEVVKAVGERWLLLSENESRNQCTLEHLAHDLNVTVRLCRCLQNIAINSYSRSAEPF